MTPDHATERRTLLLSAGANLLVGVVGFVFSLVSASQAILLDALFNLTYVAIGLFTLRVARLVVQGDDERFPHGYGLFEPLVNGIKGVLVLGISVVALIGAIQAIAAGGRIIAPGSAIGYGVFATVTCTIAAVVVRRGADRSGSPLAQADAANWIVNAAVSACVLLAFGSILLIRGTSLERFTPYIDPAVVVGVVVISISIPVRMAWQALMDLLHHAPPPEVVARSTELVREATADLPASERFVRVIQPGRTRVVIAHIVLPEDFAPGSLASLDAIRERAAALLQAEHRNTILDMVFTADRRWGAAISDGGQS